MKIIETILEPYVKCIGHNCNKQFAARSNEYITIIGNVYLGNDGGLIGNAFPAKKNFEFEEVKRYIFCPDCLKKEIFRHFQK